MENQLENKPVFEETFETDTQQGLVSKVLLFNDDWHTFDEVISQIIKAVRCTYEKARDFAFEVHVKGKAIVYIGEMTECLKVSSVLEEIELNTQIIT